MRFYLIGFVLLTFGMQSCTSVGKTMKTPNSRVELNADDFDFSDQVEATAKSTMILGIDFSRLFKVESGSIGGSAASLLGGIPVIGSSISSPTQGYALYDMMENNPGYDVVMYPQFTTKTSCPVLGLCLIVNHQTVTAKARLGKLK